MEVAAVLLSLLLVNLGVGVLSADNYSRDDFPVDFVFGSGTSAYQVIPFSLLSVTISVFANY